MYVIDPVGFVWIKLHTVLPTTADLLRPSTEPTEPALLLRSGVTRNT